jgi:hypothetical protein
VLVAIVGNFSFEALVSRMTPPMDTPYDLIRNQNDYDALPDKYCYDCMVVLYGGPFMQMLLND